MTSTSFPDLPDEHMDRAGIASMLFDTGVVIESYRVADGVQTFGFVAGVPFPMRLLAQAIGVRWTSVVENPLIGMFMQYSEWFERHLLRSVTASDWFDEDGLPRVDKIQMYDVSGRPSKLIEYKHKEKISVLVDRVIERLHQKIMSAPNPSEEFRSMIRRLDQDYEMSLIDPPPL